MHKFLFASSNSAGTWLNFPTILILLQVKPNICDLTAEKFSTPVCKLLPVSFPTLMKCNHFFPTRIYFDIFSGSHLHLGCSFPVQFFHNVLLSKLKKKKKTWSHLLCLMIFLCFFSLSNEGVPFYRNLSVCMLKYMHKIIQEAHLHFLKIRA